MTFKSSAGPWTGTLFLLGPQAVRLRTVFEATAVAAEGEAAAVASVIATVEIVKGAVIRRGAGHGVVAEGEVLRTVEGVVSVNEEEEEEEEDVLEMMTGGHLAGEDLGTMSEARLGQGPLMGLGLEEEE